MQNTASSEFLPPVVTWQSFADNFDFVLQVVCKEFAPGPAPFTQEQAKAAARLADEAWAEYCALGGDVRAAVCWVRERLSADRPSGESAPANVPIDKTVGGSWISVPC